MPAKLNPPFRAEHLGSLPRPAHLIAARKQWEQGKLARDELRKIEDACIRESVAMQERTGIRVITDGEFRKYSWRDLMFDSTDGFGRKNNDSDFIFTDFSGEKRRGNINACLCLGATTTAGSGPRPGPACCEVRRAQRCGPTRLRWR